MNRLSQRFLLVLAVLAPVPLPAAGGMDGTYMADRSSAFVTMMVPAQVYLVIDGRKATMIMRGPDGEKTMEFGAWVEHDKIVLMEPGAKRGDKGLVFYRRIGDSAILECLMCAKEGIPSVWVRVARKP